MQQTSLGEIVGLVECFEDGQYVDRGRTEEILWFWTWFYLKPVFKLTRTSSDHRNTRHSASFSRAASPRGHRTVWKSRKAVKLPLSAKLENNWEQVGASSRKHWNTMAKLWCSGSRDLFCLWFYIHLFPSAWLKAQPQTNIIRKMFSWHNLALLPASHLCSFTLDYTFIPVPCL